MTNELIVKHTAHHPMPVWFYCADWPVSHICPLVYGE